MPLFPNSTDVSPSPVTVVLDDRTLRKIRNCMIEKRKKDVIRRSSITAPGWAGMLEYLLVRKAQRTEVQESLSIV
jgi:hypothetical protein